MGAKARRQRNLSCFLSPAAETGGARCSGVPGVKESHEKEEEEDRGEAYYAGRLRELLKEAISRRLVADVPIGFYISGGLDSSVVACYIGKYLLNSYYSFSAEIDSGDLNEQRFQKIICDHVDSTHYSTRITEEEIWEHLSEVIYHAESAVKESYDVAGNAVIKDAEGNDIRENLRRNYTGDYDDKNPIYTEATPAEILAKVKSAMVNNDDKVYVYDRTDDGVYEHIFSKDDKKDFPAGTVFCIVGRSGQVYNIKTDDATPYLLNDEWMESEYAS